jgi:hypothetical protein
VSSVIKPLFERPESEPLGSDKEVREARRRARIAERNRKGRQSTILTLGSADMGSPATSRPTLLGG